ncbi:MAG: hydrogenase [Bryobacteraceae bacterium]
MKFLNDPLFGQTMITLMAAIVLVLQITVVAQKSLVAAIRVFAVQSFLLAAIAATIAWFTGAAHVYAAAVLTFLLKSLLLPAILLRLVEQIRIEHEMKPLLNVPVSVLISGLLTLLAYVIAEPLQQGLRFGGAAELGHNTLPVAVALFLIGFFLMANRRKALSQVLALLSLENGLFLAAISLTYGMPMIVEIGVFFDVLVAVLVLAILVGRIREAFDSMDVTRLSRLRG